VFESDFVAPSLLIFVMYVQRVEVRYLAWGSEFEQPTQNQTDYKLFKQLLALYVSGFLPLLLKFYMSYDLVSLEFLSCFYI